MIINGEARHNGHMVRLDPAHARLEQPRPVSTAGSYGPLKFVVDFALTLLMLVLAAPVVALACLVVKLTSRGPVLYCQTRLGRGGRPFTIYKIRTMTHDCERQSGACWSKPNDPRVTAFGRFLRRSHIDELPQLWNVLRGEMSLVGPRPERPEFLPELVQKVPRYHERLLVRPGLTGLAQVQLPPDTDLASVRRKVVYDVYYLQSMSLWLDLRILLATFAYVLGLPVYLIRQYLAIPHGDKVEHTFSNAPAEPIAVAELKPA